MKKSTACLIAVCLALTTNAQITSFETLPLQPPAVYWNGIQGIDSTITFQNGSAMFINDRDTSAWGDSWSGWGYSADTDTINGTYTNEMSAITGNGHNNSSKYAVAYLGYDALVNKIKFTSSALISSMFVTNTTYGYKTIRDGDGNFSKKFGGPSGNDPDFFRLDITGWFAGTPKPDTVRFYLADYRFSNNANDYIIKDWTLVDLSILGTVDSLTYNLVSTDNNSFGMLTPAYFCLDDLNYVIVGINELTDADGIHIYPVPMNEYAVIENSTANNLALTIININGQTIYSSTIEKYATKKINTSAIARGEYIIRIDNGEKISFKKLIK